MRYLIEQYEFCIYSKNNKVADVSIVKGELSITRYTDNILVQVFPRGNETIKDVYNFLKSRCYEDGRADLGRILKLAGMDANNPWEWCRKTHGVMYDDFYWLCFPEEKLTWEEVKVRD